MRVLLRLLLRWRLLVLVVLVVVRLRLRVSAVVVVISAAAAASSAAASAVAGRVAGSGLVHGGSRVLDLRREGSRVPMVSPLRRWWASLLDFGGGSGSARFRRLPGLQ